MKIAQVLNSNSWGEVGPEKLDEGIGGREGALLRLSREWARMGHEVTNYVTENTAKRYAEDDGFHEYIPARISKLGLATFPYDAVVAWECPSIYADPRIAEKQKVRLVEMQCAHLPGRDEVFAAVNFATGVCTLSEWHRDFMVHDSLGEKVPQSRLHVLPNCVDLAMYPTEQDPGYKFDVTPRKFVYSSSPDRGLLHLLELWPEIRSRWPDSELYVGYGAKDWISQAVWSHNRTGEMALRIAELISQDGVVDIGKVGQRYLAALQREATLWLYPLDSIQPTETGCITAIEAMASYCPVITTDCDCMAEEFGDVGICVPLPFDGAKFVQAIEYVLGDREVYTRMATEGRAFAEKRQWTLVAEEWIELFRQEGERDQ